MWAKRTRLDYELLPSSALGHSRRQEANFSRYIRWCECYKHGELSLGGRERVISRYWSEKFWLLVDELQVCALLWIAACPAATRRFPTAWCRGALFVPYANLDFRGIDAYAVKALNTTVTEELSPSSLPYTPQPLNPLSECKISNSQTMRLRTPFLKHLTLKQEDVLKTDWDQEYATYILSAPGNLLLLFSVYYIVFQPTVKKRLRHAARFVPQVERMVLGLLYLLYLPWHILVSRHVLCVEMQVLAGWQKKYTCGRLATSQLYCDVNRSCSESVESYWSWLNLASMVIYTLGLPLFYTVIAAEGAPYAGNGSHEKWVRSVEAEFFMQLSTVWSHRHYPLFSSFTRRWLYYYSWSLLKKVAIAWMVGATYQRPSGDQIRDIGLLIILGLWLAALLIFPCFRLHSTQIVAIAACAANMLTAIPRLLMSINYQSEIWFYLGLLLPLHHSLAAAVVVLAALAYSGRERWPTNVKAVLEEDNDVQEELADLDWDAFEDSLSNDLAKTAIVADDQGQVRSLQGMLDASREVLIVEKLRTPEFVRLDMLSDALRQLDSLVTILKRQKHVLVYAFEDVMDDTIAFYNEALQTTVYNYPPLTPLIPSLRSRMDKRDFSMGLSGAVRRRLLLKLFAFRQFMVIRQEVAQRNFANPFLSSIGIVVDDLSVELPADFGAGLGLAPRSKVKVSE